MALGWLRSRLTGFEGWWWDRSHGVNTAPVEGETGRARLYIPCRPSRARGALRALPIKNHRDFTFVDLGSGKGRVCLIAAELPFRLVQGVEFIEGLHERAKDNVARYRGKELARIEPVFGDATQFRFPDGNLVVCTYNPFPRDVLEKMLGNLARMIEESSRVVYLVFLAPERPGMAKGFQCFRLVGANRGYEIYRAFSRQGAGVEHY